MPELWGGGGGRRAAGGERQGGRGARAGPELPQQAAAAFGVGGVGGEGQVRAAGSRLPAGEDGALFEGSVCVLSLAPSPTLSPSISCSSSLYLSFSQSPSISLSLTSRQTWLLYFGCSGRSRRFSTVTPGLWPLRAISTSDVNLDFSGLGWIHRWIRHSSWSLSSSERKAARPLTARTCRSPTDVRQQPLHGRTPM